MRETADHSPRSRAVASPPARRLMLALTLLLIGAISAGVWRYGYVQALDQLSRRGEADLALAADRLTGQLQRYQELAVFLADHPVLTNLPERGDRAAAQALLVEAADKTAALDLAYVATSGQVLVSASGRLMDTMRGTAHFERALHGALGTAHGVDGLHSRRAYYFGAPTFGADGRVSGVLVVLVDVENVEWDWRGSNPAVFFVDEADTVFISNRSELLFWQRAVAGGLEPLTGAAPDFVSQIVGRHELWLPDWGAYIPARALHLTQPLPIIGMTAEALIDVAPARRLAWLQALVVGAILLFVGAAFWLVLQRRRVLAEANAVLEDRVAARTEALQISNSKLRREVSERQEAEAALKKAQAELVQAGKLSALGQMSAGISHELNQPLMAIQQFAENGTLFLERGRAEKAGDNLSRISAMAARMARIIKNLRAFARNESEPMGRVDLIEVLRAALELTESRRLSGAVSLTLDLPEGPVWALGGEVRLGQVFVNLINNAIDAMAESERKALHITLTPGARLAVSVQDSGPGIAEPDKIFDPFYSTKAVSSEEGMGLGLSISYGLVQSFGGRIRGMNAPEGGAIFTVELDTWREDKAA